MPSLAHLQELHNYTLVLGVLDEVDSVRVVQEDDR